jgi:hypothetical protein
MTSFGLINSINPFVKLWTPNISQEVKEKLRKREISPKGLKVENWNVVYESGGTGTNAVFKKGIVGAELLCEGIWNMPLRVSLDFYRVV